MSRPLKYKDNADERNFRLVTTRFAAKVRALKQGNETDLVHIIESANFHSALLFWQRTFPVSFNMLARKFIDLVGRE